MHYAQMPRKSLTKIDIKTFRNTFCQAAYELYVQDGYEAVTMRGGAKMLGSSPMMAYRYFDNKEDVFVSIRAMRFNDLAQALGDVNDTLSPVEYLRELGMAYAGFAHKAPDAYRLLYMIPIDPRNISQNGVKEQQRTKKILYEAACRLIDLGGSKGDPQLLAHTLWASIHGLVSLDLAGQLTQGANFNEIFPAMLDSVIRAEKNTSGKFSLLGEQHEESTLDASNG